MEFCFRIDYTKAQYALWDKLQDGKLGVITEITNSLLTFDGCAIGCTGEGIAICDYENNAVIPGTHRRIIKVGKKGYKCFASIDNTGISISVYTDQELNWFRIEKHFKLVYFKTFKEV